MCIRDSFDSHDDNELVNGSIFASAQRVMPHYLLRPAWSTRKRYSYVDTPQGMRQKLEAIETISKGLEARNGNRLFADLRYTEYVGGGHDAWTRAMNTAGLARWALRG